MEMNITYSNGQVQVDLSGEMYVEDAAIMREKLLSAIENGNKDFTITMPKLNYIDSSGLGVLVGLQKRAQAARGAVILVGAQGMVKELFEISRLNRVFEMR